MWKIYLISRCVLFYFVPAVRGASDSMTNDLHQLWAHKYTCVLIPVKQRKKKHTQARTFNCMIGDNNQWTKSINSTWKYFPKNTRSPKNVCGLYWTIFGEMFWLYFHVDYITVYLEGKFNTAPGKWVVMYLCIRGINSTILIFAWGIVPRVSFFFLCRSFYSVLKQNECWLWIRLFYFKSKRGAVVSVIVW